MVLNSVIKKRMKAPFAATRMDFEGIILKTEEDKYSMISHVESKNYNKVVNITKTRQFHRYREQTSPYQWREG